jgi:hypothetical protein
MSKEIEKVVYLNILGQGIGSIHKCDFLNAINLNLTKYKRCFITLERFNSNIQGISKYIEIIIKGITNSYREYAELNQYANSGVLENIPGIMSIILMPTLDAFGAPVLDVNGNYTYHNLTQSQFHFQSNMDSWHELPISNLNDFTIDIDCDSNLLDLFSLTLKIRFTESN